MVAMVRSIKVSMITIPMTLETPRLLESRLNSIFTSQTP
jgi:hypothetical protein